MFGRKFRYPMDQALPLLALPENTSLTQKEYLEKLRDRLSGLWARALETNDVAREHQARDYNRRHTPVVFEKGDRVWMHDPKGRKFRGKKLDPRWYGPYTVDSAIPVESGKPVTYLLLSPTGRKLRAPVPVQRLKRYYKSTFRPMTVLPAGDEDSEDMRDIALE